MIASDEKLEISMLQRKLAARRGRQGFAVNCATISARIAEITERAEECKLDKSHHDVTG